MPRLNGKFVSQAVFDAAQTKGETVTETPATKSDPSPRNVSPLVLATRELTKAKARLDKATAAAAKVTSVEDELAEALEAYNIATKTLNELL